MVSRGGTVPLLDFVEQTAASLRVPPLKLLVEVLDAIVTGALPVSYSPEFSERMPGMSVTQRLQWLQMVRERVADGMDPMMLRQHLRMILVRRDHAQKWLRGRLPQKLPGPLPGENTYARADEKICREMRTILRAGRARSAFGAAKAIAEKMGEGYLPGHGSLKTKCERLSKRYRALYEHTN